MNRITSAERRQVTRFDALEYIVVRAGDREETAVLQDAGLGGVRFLSRLGLVPGQACEVVVGTSSDPVALHGEVRHCQGNSDGTMYATGVRFVPGDADERRAVAEFLHGVIARNFLTG